MLFRSPDWRQSTVRALLEDSDSPSWAVLGPAAERSPSAPALFQALRDAVRDRQCLDFHYRRPNRAAKRHQAVEPLKLLNHNGIWYLQASEQGQTKTFALSGIDGLLLVGRQFTAAPQSTQPDAGIWASAQPQRVRLHVATAAAHYFARRDLLPGQQLLSTQPDGSLLLEATVDHPLQLLPVVRHWIPHVRILEPADWQERLEDGLRSYLGDA